MATGPLGASSKNDFGPPEIGPDEITLHEQLGSGAFGAVYRGTCRAVDVAVKVPSSRMKITQRQLDAFAAEVKIMSKIYHPNVALFMGACTAGDQIRIVSELLAGDVEHLVFDEKRELTLHARMKMAKDAAQGMAWLHGMTPCCLHRDLKISNLLYDKSGVVKVCDLGLSSFMEPGNMMQDATSRPKGTPLYMAPEVWLSRPFNERADVYSFGILLWEMLMRTQAFSHHNSLQTFKRAITVDKERPPIPDNCLPSLKKLMEDCWADDPAQRPLFPEIVDRLGDLLIETAIQFDPIGYRFWRDTWPRKTSVAWNTFFPAFYAVMQLDPPIDNDPSTVTDNAVILNLRCLKELAVTKQDGEEVVTLQRFGDLLGWFGPISATKPLPETSVVDRMRHILSATFGPEGNHWFFGWLGVTEAEKLLSTKPAGTFVVRFSSSAHPTWFTISKTQQSGDKVGVVSLRVEHETGGDFRINFRKQIHSFKTLPELISSSFARDQLLLTQSCVNSPYAHLFSKVSTDAAATGYEMDDEAISEF